MNIFLLNIKDYLFLALIGVTEEAKLYHKVKFSVAEAYKSIRTKFYYKQLHPRLSTSCKTFERYSA